MAMMKQSSINYNSSNYGEDAARQVDVLASCYIVDPCASLKGLHYCTTSLTGRPQTVVCSFLCVLTAQGPSGIPEVPSTGLPSPPSSPPLAAITSTNQLALTPKEKSRTGYGGRSVHGSKDARPRRRGGATSRIREECERFFCETLRAMFLGERDMAGGSYLTDVYRNSIYPFRNRDYKPCDPLTPPDDYPMGGYSVAGSGVDQGVGDVSAWLEIWDYAGGSSFRAFVSDDGEAKALFVFFDAGVVERDLKQGLVALIELADGPLECSHMVICVDRAMAADERQALMKGLQWAGFSLSTLDFWTGGMDVTSSRWLFMGMEV